jgi:gas vesicle protein
VSLNYTFGNHLKRLSISKFNNRKLGGRLAEQKQQQQKGNESRPAENTSGMSPILIGSAAGIGIGLLASPETGRKITGKITQSEVLRSCTRELQRTAQEIITEQAAILIRRGAMNSFQMYQEKLAPRNSGNSPSSSQYEKRRQNLSEDHYNELKQENQELNSKMERLDDKLDTLIEKLDN